MKKQYVKTTKIYKSLIGFFMCILLLPTVAKADLIIESLQGNGGFYPNTTQDINVSFVFDSESLEYVDRVEFYLEGYSGYELTHGSDALSPFISCGSGQGDQITGQGPAWVHPDFPNGGSECGPFQTTEEYTFPLKLSAPYNSSDNSVLITVRLVGDGFGGEKATILEQTVRIQRLQCLILCPEVITEYVDENLCQKDVSVPTPTVLGNCTVDENYSGTYGLGSYDLVYSTVDVFGNTSKCTSTLMVLDNVAPEVTNTSDVTVQLGTGECTHKLGEDWQVNENCGVLSKTVSHLSDTDILDESQNCPLGDTRFLQRFEMSKQDIHTSFIFSTVRVGVLEAMADDALIVNVYKQIESEFKYSSLKHLSRTIHTVENYIEAGVVSVSVPETTVSSTDIIVIEVVSPLGNNSLILGLSKTDGTPSYVASEVCGIPEPTELQAGKNNGAHIELGGRLTPYTIRKTHDYPYEVGDNVPVGSYNFSFEAVDASGNVQAFSYTSTITENTTNDKSLACNDKVFVSIQETCSETITSDMILEGDHYGCYDNYTVEVVDANTGYNYGNQVDASMIGKNLTVKLTDIYGNSCESQLIVEDKAPAVLECRQVSVSCGENVEPGSKTEGWLSFYNPSITLDLQSQVLPIEVKGVSENVEEIRIGIELEHKNIENLVAMAESPSGKIVQLFTEMSTKGDSLSLVLSDDAKLTYQALLDTCKTDVSCVRGNYQPESSLQVLKNDDPNGEWKIYIRDITDNEPIKVKSTRMFIKQKQGIVPFPTSNDVTYTKLSDNKYRVFGMQGCATADLWYTDDVEMRECDPFYSSIIRRTWNAVDEHGNLSVPCVQNIFVIKRPFSLYDFPPNYDDVERPALSCRDFGDTIPSIEVTGGVEGNVCNNIHVFPYKDTRIDICGSSYKILREFKLIEWCTGEVYEHTQIIKVKDDEGPILEEMDEQVVSTDVHACNLKYHAKKPTVVSDCSDSFEYQLAHFYNSNTDIVPSDGNYTIENVVVENGAFYVKDMPIGRSYLRWKVTDECGNASYLYFTVVVEDQVAPDVICLQYTDVNLGTDGTIKVAAEVFDNGSHDNCEIVDFTVRKMVDTCKIVQDHRVFRDSVYFCCAEVGSTIMVEMKATDKAGNYNTCMVEVRINDKLPPVVVCPEDKTLECQADVDDLNLTGRAEGYDNCGLDTMYYVDQKNINNCGVGTVLRTWHVVDKQGLKHSCQQVLTLVDNDPFKKSDIVWPKDYDSESCVADLSPEKLPKEYNVPTYKDDFCSLVDATYKDQVFDVVEGACKKVLRSWTVIDWCTYDDSGESSDGYYTHLQVLKVVQTEAPVIKNCQDTVLAIYESCEGLVDIGIHATDDCTPVDQLRYAYTLDIGADGIMDDTKDTSAVRRVLPAGKHRISWKVEDGCGNTSLCTQDIEVKEAKLPSPYCITEVATVIMPASGSIDIWAKDFNLDSYDNCTPKEQLKYSFSKDTSDTSRIFYCSDLTTNPVDVELHMWVTDLAGNQDFCTVRLQIQDNAGLCAQGTDISVGGRVETIDGLPLNGATVSLYGNGMETRSMTTENQGRYIFNNLPKEVDYRINATYEVDFRKGVSTRDLIATQLHLLGLKKFNHVGQFIAADVDNSKKISPNDLFVMRKAILNLIDGWPKHDPVIFVSKSEECNDIKNPWKCGAGIELNNVNTHMGHQNMAAVKIGDVNASFQDYLRTVPLETRGGETYEIQYTLEKTAEHTEISFYGNSSKVISGMQLALGIQGSEVEVVSGAMEVTADMIHTDQGQLLMSISSGDIRSYESDDVLFTIVLDKHIDNIHLTNGLEGEVYDQNLDISGISLTPRGLDTEVFAVMQNMPNPYNDKTTISYTVPRTCEAQLIIYDVNGKEVLSRTMQAEQGSNTISIDQRDIPESGVYFYRIAAGEDTATMKMIKL